MELLLEINESDIGFSEKESFVLPYKLRKAARAVVYNETWEIAILHVANGDYHKLPGGGFEEWEDVIAALRREVLEEAGCEMEVIREVGLTIEYRNKFSCLQMSYCFVAKTVGDLGQPNFDAGELADGFSLIWVRPNEAVSLLSNDAPETYGGKFMRKRDLALLNRALELDAYH